MQRKPKIVPAQRDKQGNLHFWLPRKRGSEVVEYEVALEEMRRKYGRPQLESDLHEAAS